MSTRHKLILVAGASLALSLPTLLGQQTRKPSSLEVRVAKLEVKIKAQDEEIQSLRTIMTKLEGRSSDHDDKIKYLTAQTNLLANASGFDLHPDASHYYYWCGGLAVGGSLIDNINAHISGVAGLPGTDACFVIIDRKYTTAEKSP